MVKAKNKGVAFTVMYHLIHKIEFTPGLYIGPDTFWKHLDFPRSIPQRNYNKYPYPCTTIHPLISKKQHFQKPFYFYIGLYNIEK